MRHPSTPHSYTGTTTLANRFASMFLTVFALAVALTILVRSLKLDGAVLLGDLQHYTFAFLVLFAVLSAFISNRHVRAEWLKGPQATRSRLVFQRTWLALLVILPLGIVIVTALPEVMTSVANLEGSREHRGLPGYFLVKAGLPVVFIWMIFAAFQKIAKSDLSEN